MRARRLTVIPPLPPTYLLGRKRPRARPFPLDEPSCRLYAKGRHGIWHGATALGLQGTTVLAPAYHHGSEIEALIQAGCRIRFYDIGDDLSPIADDLEAGFDGDVSALYVIHVLGFPQDVERWRRWCDERELFLIEDVAQGWLGTRGGRPLGSWGDMAVFCIYKTLPVPDGAALYCIAPADSVPPDGWGMGRVFRRAGAWLAGRSGVADEFLSKLMPAEEGLDEPDMELGRVEGGPVAATRRLIDVVDTSSIASRRRANFKTLKDRLTGLVPTPFDRDGDGWSPFALPIWVEDKDSLYHRLIEHRIIAQDLWAVPHPILDTASFPRSAARRSHTLALPVHQGLSIDDLDRIADVVLTEECSRS